MSNHTKFWKLVNNIPIECGVIEWALFFQSKERLIKDTQMPLCRVSTVFLGLDHSFYFGPEPRPSILFESMIFGGPLDDEQWRYATYTEAKAGHKQLCLMAEKATQEHSSNIMIGLLIGLLIWMVFN